MNERKRELSGKNWFNKRKDVARVDDKWRGSKSEIMNEENIQRDNLKINARLFRAFVAVNYSKKSFDLKY